MRQHLARLGRKSLSFSAIYAAN
ncbi:hypothetical protein [Escherichia coli]